MEWISCKDRLPDIKEHCWRTDKAHPVWCKDVGLTYAYLTTEGWIESHRFGNSNGDYADEYDDVMKTTTHWAPLLAAPDTNNEKG
jgi:hypothetical protein